MSSAIGQSINPLTREQQVSRYKGLINWVLKSRDIIPEFLSIAYDVLQHTDYDSHPTAESVRLMIETKAASVVCLPPPSNTDDHNFLSRFYPLVTSVERLKTLTGNQRKQLLAFLHQTVRSLPFLSKFCLSVFGEDFIGLILSPAAQLTDDDAPQLRAAIRAKRTERTESTNQRFVRQCTNDRPPHPLTASISLNFSGEHGPIFVKVRGSLQFLPLFSADLPGDQNQYLSLRSGDQLSFFRQVGPDIRGVVVDIPWVEFLGEKFDSISRIIAVPPHPNGLENKVLRAATPGNLRFFYKYIVDTESDDFPNQLLVSDVEYHQLASLLPSPVPSSPSPLSPLPLPLSPGALEGVSDEQLRGMVQEYIFRLRPELQPLWSVFQAITPEGVDPISELVDHVRNSLDNQGGSDQAAPRALPLAEDDDVDQDRRPASPVDRCPPPSPPSVKSQDVRQDESPSEEDIAKAIVLWVILQILLFDVDAALVIIALHADKIEEQSFMFDPGPQLSMNIDNSLDSYGPKTSYYQRPATMLNCANDHPFAPISSPVEVY